MKSNEIIRELMQKNSVKFSELAKAVHIGNNVLANRLNRENTSTDKLNELLNVLGYKIVLMPKDVAVSDGWYEVDDSDHARPSRTTP